MRSPTNRRDPTPRDAGGGFFGHKRRLDIEAVFECEVVLNEVRERVSAIAVVPRDARELIFLLDPALVEHAIHAFCLDEISGKSVFLTEMCALAARALHGIVRRKIALCSASLPRIPEAQNDFFHDNNAQRSLVPDSDLTEPQGQNSMLPSGPETPWVGSHPISGVCAERQWTCGCAVQYQVRQSQ